MAFRLRNFAPLGPEEAVAGWIHKMIGWKRKALGLSVNRFVDSYISPAPGVSIEVASNADQSPAFCPVCGYAMAAISLKGGWKMEACSATNIERWFSNERFASWADQIPAAQSTLDPASQTHMQTSGH